MLGPSTPPSQAGAVNGEACGPDGSAGAAQDLPGLARPRFPNVDFMVVTARRSNEVPVGGDRRGEHHVVVLDISLDRLTRDNVPDNLWMPQARWSTTGRQ